jgi:hypothetical protein
MGLLRKIGILVGALVHKPFMPKPEKVELHDKPRKGTARRDGAAIEAQQPQVEDTGRVADLIAQQQQEE